MCLCAFSQAPFQVIFRVLWSMAPPSWTFLKGVTTGAFMMKISGFWDRPLLLPFHGVPFIGSFGSTHKPRSVQRGRRPLQALESLCPVFVCLGVFVLLTIGVVTVWALPLGMIVSNVRAPTMLYTVIFVPKLVGFNHKIEVQPNLHHIQPPSVQLNSNQPP